ncbi:MAG: hypothetical protein HY820_35915 [Acidobacteria bacterium]|nr:hypothetical protein [Acidobacteriota bacterium]
MPYVEKMDIPHRHPPLNADDMKNPNVILPNWINVSYDVSEQLRNKKSVETRFVQLLLMSVYAGPPNRPGPGVDLSDDGVFGDKTRKWIQHFQQHRDLQDLVQPRKPTEPDRGPTLPVRPDGYVHRAYGNVDQKIHFTIYRLNRALAALNFRKFNLLMLNSSRLGWYFDNGYNPFE